MDYTPREWGAVVPGARAGFHEWEQIVLAITLRVGREGVIERTFQAKACRPQTQWAGSLGQALPELASSRLAGQGGRAHLALFSSCCLDAFLLNPPFVIVSLRFSFELF